ncbi:hypothetical protein A3F37_01800 [Candidatus Saccharibacteria bacterium RIFCSPHIGHO2_12_FULL_41_12]|nr:MAG: hypothetical protein A3F37_01800 [Candidatus Saccharibacteria bacterium RIFCSPHIGHO2_12_FULL_41_12]
MTNNKKRVIAYVSGLVAISFAFSGVVVAQFTSPNYKVEESYFGTGGELETISPNYKSRQSTGSLGVGNGSSANNDATSGFTTPSDPFLEFAVSGATVDLGTLSESSTSSDAAQAGACNCSFYVRSYMSLGYSVITVSQPPTSESNNSLQAKSVLAVPSTDPDVEEFGINVVNNTSPDIGADPINDPDGTFADGQASTGYSTPNQFKYSAGDIIASSPATAGNQGVGKTNYTISYIAKISRMSKAGSYVMNHDLVAVPTF